MLAIMDYGAGNQTSVARALEYLGIPHVVTADPRIIDGADGIIFPGVGSAAQAMGELARTGLDRALIKAAQNSRPVLGICLGCQIALEESEEGSTRTLGLVEGVCKRFEDNLQEEDGSPIRIPHMGWNGLAVKKPHPILENVPPDAEFYFVHGYYTCPKEEYVIATSFYGREFCAIYGRDNLWFTQFHPEKSGRPGLAILANFNRFCQGG